MKGSVIQNLLNWFIKREASLPFYKVPQQYSVSFSFEIFNKTSRDISLVVVMPVFCETTYQHVVANTIFPEGGKRKKEDLFKNEYICWMLHLISRKREIVRQDATIIVTPESTDLESIARFSLGDYALIQQSRYYKLFSNPSRSIKPNNARIREIVKKVVGEEKKISSIFTLLNEYVISHPTYGNPIDGLYPADAVFLKQPVDCGGFDTFLASLLIAVGIPARIVSGFFAGYEKNTMHAWVEAMLPDGSWIPLDPSLEQLQRKGKTKKISSLGFVGSDRIVLSHGCDMALEVGDMLLSRDILQNPFFVGADDGADISSKISFVTTVLSST